MTGQPTRWPRRLALALLPCALVMARAQAPSPVPAVSGSSPAANAVPAPEAVLESRGAPLDSFLASPRLYHAAQNFLLHAAVFDMEMTDEGLHHPTLLHLTIVNGGLTRTVNFDFTSRFREGGWARFMGARNAGGVIAANVAADVVMALVSRRLARRGPRWRMLATFALAAQGIVHISAGSTWVALPGRLAAPYAQFHPVWIR